MCRCVSALGAYICQGWTYVCPCCVCVHMLVLEEYVCVSVSPSVCVSIEHLGAPAYVHASLPLRPYPSWPGGRG